MNYLNGDFNVIDMDSFEIYIQWENGYPFATKGRGNEYTLTRDQEVELMSDKIVQLEAALSAALMSERIKLRRIESLEREKELWRAQNIEDGITIARATGATP